MSDKVVLILCNLPSFLILFALGAIYLSSIKRKVFLAALLFIFVLTVSIIPAEEVSGYLLFLAQTIAISLLFLGSFTAQIKSNIWLKVLLFIYIVISWAIILFLYALHQSFRGGHF